MFTNKLLTLLFTILLSACGYHLRGAYDIPSGLNNVYLDGGSMPLREQFRKIIRPASGSFADAPEHSGLIIRLFDEQSNNRVLSLNERGRSNELELYYRLSFEVVKPGNTILLPKQPIEIKREYFNNQQDIIAKENEQSVIHKEMLEEAVRGIVDRTRFALEADRH